jgi:hypothetical protein
MRSKIDAMKGNATTGSLADLRTNVDSVDNKVVNHLLKPEDEAAAHEKLEDIQDWLATDSTASCGAADAVDGFNTDLAAWA